MKRFLCNLYGLFQILFYLSASLTAVAAVFSRFGIFASRRTVGNLILTTIGFLVSYFICYSLHRMIYKKFDYRTIPEHLDELDTDKEEEHLN